MFHALSFVRLLSLATLAAATFTLAYFALEFTRLRGGVALLWLTNGPLLVTMCLQPRRRWVPYLVAYAIGLIAAVILVSPMWRVAPLWTTVNIIETALTAGLLRRWGVARSFFDTTRAIALFVAATVAGPVFGAAASALIARDAIGAPMLDTAADWWLAHSLGLMIAAPLTMLVARRAFYPASSGNRIRTPMAFASMTLLLVTTIAVFMQSRFPLLFLPILPLMIVTMQLRRDGAAAGIVVLAMIGGATTAHGSGPLMTIDGDEGLRLQFFNLYLAVSFLLTLPVAAVLTQRDALMDQLGASEARYRMLADHSTDIMLTIAPDGTILYASQAIRELGGFEPSALIGSDARALVYPGDLDRVAAAYRETFQNPAVQHRTEYRAKKADGTIGWFEGSTRAVVNDAGEVTALVSVLRDLDERKRREDALVQAATTDPLTGLLNRAALHAAVRTAQARRATGVPATLALLDLDHFKRVNDTHGHACGDQALLLLADLLRENLRESDAIGRVGGEEFAILFNGAALSTAKPICERLCAQLADRPFFADRVVVRLTMSIGVTALEVDEDLEKPFRRADGALYAAKNHGRNRVESATV